MGSAEEKESKSVCGDAGKYGRIPWRGPSLCIGSCVRSVAGLRILGNREGLENIWMLLWLP